MGLTPPPLHGDDLFDDDDSAACGLDLHAVCEQAVSRVRDELHAKQPIDTDFGPMAQVAAPRGDFFQVMVNILLNAEDVARRLDSELGRVMIATRGGADHAVVEVRASAPPPSQPGRAGKDAPDAPAVRWEHFGMPVCQKILGSFGGTLSLETDPTRGTTFRVTVPVPRTTMHPPPRAEAAPPPSLTAPPLSRASGLHPSVTTPAGSFRPDGQKRKATREMFAVIPPKKRD
jgi:hypothetical protein